MQASEAEEQRTLADWQARIEAAERSGDLLQAADLAAGALAQHPDSDLLKYRHLLNLARAGALTAAERLWPLYDLPQDQTDYVALGARLQRARGFLGGPGAAGHLAAAAAAYGALFQASDDPFPGINAAVLHALTGESETAAALAGRVLELTTQRPADSREARYNLAADELIAALILDRDERAAAAAMRLMANRGNAAAFASTRRLLQRLVPALGRGEALLAFLTPPASLHYTGHMAAPPAPPARASPPRPRPPSPPISSARWPAWRSAPASARWPPAAISWLPRRWHGAACR